MLRSISLTRPGVVSARSMVLGVIADYVALTKPPIVLLLLITALGGMFLASQGAPPVTVALLLLCGGASAAGGASAINHYLDRDLDELMLRTRRRPLPGGRVSPWAALTFGIGLNIFAFLLLATTVNLLSAAITLSGTLFYVFIYTWWLKRSTPQNIVIGGAAGAVPPLAGWAAITGGIELPALYLFAVIFFWTPPHFWALALMMRDDYARARVPMLPVVVGEAETKKNIFLYTIILVVVSVLFFTTQAVGWVYLSSALVLGGIFLYKSWTMAFATGDHEGTNSKGQELSVYLYSLLYLALLFLAIIVDSVVRV